MHSHLPPLFHPVHESIPSRNNVVHTLYTLVSCRPLVQYLHLIPPAGITVINRCIPRAGYWSPNYCRHCHYLCKVRNAQPESADADGGRCRHRREPSDLPLHRRDQVSATAACSIANCARQTNACTFIPMEWQHNRARKQRHSTGRTVPAVALEAAHCAHRRCTSFAVQPHAPLYLDALLCVHPRGACYRSRHHAAPTIR